MVDAPSLEPFQVRLSEALSDLLYLQMSLLTAEGQNEVTYKGHTCDSLTSLRYVL